MKNFDHDIPCKGHLMAQLVPEGPSKSPKWGSIALQGLQIALWELQNRSLWRQEDLHRLTAPPRWPQVTSQRGQEGSKRRPWTPQRTPRGALRTPRGGLRDAQGGPRGSKMAQVGSKVGPEMRKVAPVKLLKNHWFLHCLGPPGGVKMTPGGPQMSQLGVIWMAVR